MADTDDHPIPETGSSPAKAPADDVDRLDEADRAIAKHARYLKETISEIEAMLGASVWRNPFM
jgi:hypothetical protein